MSSRGLYGLQHTKHIHTHTHTHTTTMQLKGRMTYYFGAHGVGARRWPTRRNRRHWVNEKSLPDSAILFRITASACMCQHKKLSHSTTSVSRGHWLSGERRLVPNGSENECWTHTLLCILSFRFGKPLIRIGLCTTMRILTLFGIANTRTHLPLRRHTKKAKVVRGHYYPLAL